MNIGSATRTFPFGDDSSPFFSFHYDGRTSETFLAGWDQREESGVSDATHEIHSMIYTDPTTGLEVRCEAIRHKKVPALEWVLYFKNTSRELSPMLEEIHALDLALELDPSREATLHYSRGGVWAPQAFEPLEKKIGPGEDVDFSPTRTVPLSHTDAVPAAGLSSMPYLPFFNLDVSDEGLIVAVGWSGQWQVSFRRNTQGGMALQAGMERTHLRLRPGEEIRTPRILLLGWQGEWLDGQNRFRHLILDDYTPRPGGKPLESPMIIANWGSEPMAQQVEKVQAFASHQLPFEVYWVDGGWAEGNRPNSFRDWTYQVGNWDESREIYPEGLEALSRVVHEAGMKFLLWFEPTRAYEGTKIHREHPEWLLGRGPGFFKDHWLFDLGNPEAREWLVDLISERIERFGVDIYWSDFCFEDPLYYWRQGEPADRDGMTEIRWVEGFYLHWSELLRRHPNLLILNCAGGGRMIDLELMKLSVPLWTSDLQAIPDCPSVYTQGHTFGSLFWLPISGTAVCQPNQYSFRSAQRSTVQVRWQLAHPLDADFPFDWVRQMLDQHREIRPYYSGDFYPLTPYSLDESTWMAYQMHRPDLDEGMVMAFRRQWNDQGQMIFRLRGLNEAARYTVTNMDNGETCVHSGRDLMAEGLKIGIGTIPGSNLLTYRRLET